MCISHSTTISWLSPRAIKNSMGRNEKKKSIFIDWRWCDLKNKSKKSFALRMHSVLYGFLISHNFIVVFPVDDEIIMLRITYDGGF